ncbi:hypothetical protein ETB97_000878 [Aspergillus alliaceus]|uniref:Uncharacterized protein n=1 Tax=Petromyces alliaceus TaxID=209559 RepID=A0A8H6A7W6_PETAA|nr:hypothetical protein ETB97_000878 [Aspergillus burnettii]
MTKHNLPVPQRAWATLVSDPADELKKTAFRPSDEISPGFAVNTLIGNDAALAKITRRINRHFSPAEEFRLKDVIFGSGVIPLLRTLIYTLLDEYYGVRLPIPGYTWLSHAIEKQNLVHGAFADTEQLPDQFSSTRLASQSSR